MAQNITLIPKGYRAEGGSGFSLPKLKGAVLAAFIILAVSFFVWIGLLAATQITNGKIKDLSRQIQEAYQKRDLVFEKQALALGASVDSIKDILAGHKYWSLMLDDLAAVTHPDVVFLKLDGETAPDGSLKLVIEARAEGLEQIAESLSIWQGMENFQSLKISNVSLSDEGGIDFTAEMMMKEEILNSK